MTITGYKGTCEHCKKSIYGLNFNTFYEDNSVTVKYKNYSFEVYLCPDCKKKLALFILGDKK